ncbi:MAG: class I SAM-dependent methyltransferase [Pirellulaceae bacterium]|nr:class I SAM-dependent methyltransferase [Pirellulaceae bacterium]
MGQANTGVRALLSHPKVYNAFQKLMGTQRIRRELAGQWIRAEKGDSVLDIGCGTAEIIEFLPPVTYYGFDVSSQYVKAAHSKFGARGQFFCQKLTPDMLDTLPDFDVVLAIGLLHHMDDGQAVEVLSMIQTALRRGGRLISLDPVIDPEQRPIARYLAVHDRGCNVRTAVAYRALAEKVFRDIRGTVRHRHCIPLVPYTNWIMECTA